MPAGVRGDFSRLHSLRDKVARLASHGLLTELNDELSEAAVDLIDREISSQTGPYGEQWPPTTEGEPAFGGATGDTTARATSRGFTIHSGIPFGRATHQRGRTIKPRNGPFLVFKLGDRIVFAREVRVPARPLVPEQSKGLGPLWRERFHRIANGIIARSLR